MPSGAFDFANAVKSAEANLSKWEHVLKVSSSAGDMVTFRSAQSAYNDALEAVRKTKLAAAKIADSEGTSISRESVALSLRRIHAGIPKNLRTTIFEHLLILVQTGTLPTRDQLRELVSSAVDAACLSMIEVKFEFESPP